MFIHKQLPTFDAVQAGSKAVTTIDPGVRIAAVHLEFGNAAAVANDIDDVLDRIIVKYGNKAQRTYRVASRLNDLNGLNGQEYLSKADGTAGQADRVHYLSIWFANPWRLTPAERIAPCWNLFQELQVECTFKAGLAAPFIRGTYEYDSIPAGVQSIGDIQKVYDDDFGATGTSRDIQTLAKRDRYEAISFYPTSDGKYASVIKFTRNGQDLAEDLTYKQNQVNLLNWGLNPDLGATPRFDLVFDRSDNILDGMLAEGVREITAKVTWNSAASGTMPVLSQRTGPAE